MEKTIEEIRPIVLAYCNAICKTMDDSVYWSEDQTVNIHGSDDTYIATCGGVVVPIRQSMQDRIWLAAYRLLGLETRDAVEELQGKINRLEMRNNELLDECVHRMRTDSVGTSLYDLIILAHENGVPMITKSNMYLNGDPKQIPVYTWASTTHENPITHLIDLIAQRDAERAKSAKWESRTWKILGIVRKREAEQRPKTSNVLKALRECGANLEAERERSKKLAGLAISELESERANLADVRDTMINVADIVRTSKHHSGESRHKMLNEALSILGTKIEALEGYKKGGAND